MIAFVGLGNPGPEYAATKHNAGFWVVDELARRWAVAFRPGKGDYLLATAREDTVLLAKPTTGMNASGVAVKDLVYRWELNLPELFVIVDDVDLPLGVLRIRPAGGDGCHKGLASVIYHLQDTHFPRIRFGIATAERTRPAEEFVLKPFRRRDVPLAREMVDRAADAVESILRRGLEPTMSEYNRKYESGEYVS
jgi:PTH1 family peptidyl-tRNA hydrolase